MASGTMISHNPKTFGFKTRNSNATSGDLFGWYFPDTKKVLLTFYFTANTSVSTNPLFTVDDEYKPSSNRSGAGIIKQGNGAGVNLVFGNFSMTPNGELKNVATSTCYECFGVMMYSI